MISISISVILFLPNKWAIIFTFVNSSTCSIFADDTKIYNTCENNSTLQKYIIALQDWSHKWQLYFNCTCTKCKCIHFGKNNPCNDYYFHNEEGNQSIPKCTEEKDLGVTFDNSLKFDLHIDAIVRNKKGK